MLYFGIMNNQDWKKKFRYGKEWKEFRQKLIKKQKVDPITGTKLSKLANCHHMDLNEEHYKDISDEDNFVMLNKLSHDMVHFMFLKSKPHEWRKRIEGLIKILEKMEELNGKE